MAVAEVRQPAMRDEARETLAVRIAKLPVHLFLLLIGILWLIPAAGLFVTSLLPAATANARGWWHVFSKPSEATFANYRMIFHNTAITHALFVTAEVTIGATILPILIASLAAYALAWIEFPGRDWAFVTIVGLMVVPVQMALIPIFSLYNKLGIFDTVLSLVLFHTAFGLPFAIFLLRNFFVGIPKDILESARIDGSSEWRIFFRLILPLGLPAIASLAIFQFLWTWNDLIVSLTFGTTPITVWIY
ncbi:MAG TPA: carbohydrate ABC transporter permease, partial [Candidatus Limnocylindria bacterium]